MIRRGRAAAIVVGVSALVFAASKSGYIGAQEADSVREATAALDAFMEAFNARDPEAWAATLNYPHVRIASGSVRVWESEEALADSMDFEAFAERFGWDHSAWDKREIVQAGPDKVHFATTFSRYDAEGHRIATFDSLYVVTQVNGRWGTQARSSFAL